MDIQTGRWKIADREYLCVTTPEEAAGWMRRASAGGAEGVFPNATARKSIEHCLRPDRSPNPRFHGELSKGCESMADMFPKVEKVMREGWHDGADLVRGMAAELREGADEADLRVESIRRKRVWGRNGDMVDMRRVWNGKLDTAWSGFERRRSTSRGMVVPVVVGVGGNYGTDAKDLLWRAVAGLAVVDALEDAGYRCEIYAIWSSEHFGEGRTTTLLPLKQAEEPVRAGYLAATAAHPAVFRTALFTTICVHEEVDVGTGLGHSIGRSGHADALQMAKDAGKILESAILVDTGKDYSRAGALKEAKRALREIASEQPA